MFWADKVAQEIISSGEHKPYWIDDMFTPSGFAHVGSLRGPLVHDMVARALRHAGEQVKWTYIMNDFDPIDGLPAELEASFAQYMGVSLRSVPSPVEGFTSFAEYFAKDFEKVLRDLGVDAEILSSWDMYHEGKFNDVIRIALDNSAKIQDIYQKVSGSKKRDAGWLPLQVVCEQCGKLGTTRVHDWDGDTVAYTCEPEMVKWAKGCGYSGRINPFDGRGKLPWKVDWPAHWKVLGITIEGAGKDHSTAGGSRDIAKELCADVFHYPNPFNIPYEFFLIGGKKMSSSKGLGLKSRDLTSVLPPEIGRFLFTRTDYKKAIEFDPVGTLAIPMLFDEYQKCANAYFNKTDEELAQAFVYSQITEAKNPENVTRPPAIRFSVLAQWVQMPNMQERIKAEGLEEWAKYARIWVERFATDSEKFVIQKELPESAGELTQEQKTFLGKLGESITENVTPEDFQVVLYDLAKSQGLSPKEAFAAVYTALLGKNHGPRAAWLILSLDREFVKTRFKEVAAMPVILNESEGSSPKEDSLAGDDSSQLTLIARTLNPEIFSIAPEVSQKYPSISIGIATIKGVTITKSNPALEKEKAALLESLSNLTTEKLGEYPEVQSYRKLYKDMGVDWHSRRPSPEALLRRVALGKGLYMVNTCVDAYNLIVMKHRISIGAFDLDAIQFPTKLRFPSEGDDILLLGDTEPTVYKPSELAYFDVAGGYNIDFNFRDAQRTAVQETTENLYINVDGVYDVTPEQVEDVLREACETIIRYCGGTIAEFAVVTT